MYNKFEFKWLALSILLATILPATAQDLVPEHATQISQSTQNNPVKQGASSSSKTHRSLGQTAVKLPVAAASFVVASIVGTPISMARHSADELSHATKGTINGMRSPFSAPVMVVVGPLAIASSIIGGTVIEGPWTAMETSWAYAMDKPFSKDAFSLGELEKWDE